MGILCRWCVSHTEYPALGNSQSEARGKSRHQNNRAKVVRNLEERTLGTKRKYPEQSLTKAEDLTID